MAEKIDAKHDVKHDVNYKHIVRVVDVDLPGNKPIKVALTGIKGIGVNFADSVCKIAHIDGNAKAGSLNDEQLNKLNDIVGTPSKYGFPKWMYNHRRDFDTGEDKHMLTGTLTFTVDNDLKRLKKIKSRKGLRHQAGLPVRGQRTKAHFRKHKGKVVGVAKKKTAPAAKSEGKKDSGKK
jgi:small subunit ribosomal protein S13